MFQEDIAIFLHVQVHCRHWGLCKRPENESPSAGWSYKFNAVTEVMLTLTT